LWYLICDAIINKNNRTLQHAAIEHIIAHTGTDKYACDLKARSNGPKIVVQEHL